LRRLVLVLSVSAALLSAVPAQAAPGKEAAQAAAAQFGQALVAGNAAGIKSVLPSRGRVQLHLSRLGPENGHFSPSQVEALIRDFLAHGSVTTCELLRVEQDREGFALAHARAEITDQQGHVGLSDLHLKLQVEENRWVLREIRETPK